MARICGICPVSHLIASSKACDEILAVEPPPTGADLRRVMNLAQIVQSNALSFFHLSSPDLLFGFDADPAQRNIIGVAAGRTRSWPATASASAGSASRSSSGWAASGSTRRGSCPAASTRRSSAETRDRILSTIPEAIAAIERALAWYKSSLVRWEDEAASFGDFRSAFMGLVDEDGNVDHYDGALRVMDADGQLLADRIDPRGYAGLPRRGGRAVVVPEVDLLEGRSATPTASTGSARWRASIVADQMGTPRADAELDEFRAPARPRARAARSTTTTPG